MSELFGPRVATSVDDLIAGATDRVALHPDDGKSGASFEQLTIDGEKLFLKVLSYEGDWIMRCSGNTDHWEYKTWCAGLYHRAPEEIDHAMLAMALDETGPKPRLAMLMRDISDGLVPPGDEPVSIEQHDRFMDHMAAFHAAYWGWQDTIDLGSTAARLLFLAPATIAPELRADEVPTPIQVAAEGWAVLPERAPAMADIVHAVHLDPDPLAQLLDATPQTFVTGDWKMGNLGSHPDGRTIVLDWAYPGAAGGCWDLAWYLAINRARLPRSKDESIATYRAGLERRGIDTAAWFDRQLGLSFIGMMALFGWEKAVGDADELAWWTDAVARSVPYTR